jgi:Tol biopolymer transport system component/tRNA A-37 threonylcarbamoyl transferase component Bud32
MPLEPGSRIGPYEIVSIIPAAGAGEAYKAADNRLNRTVTIKVLPPEIHRDSALRQRLEHEVQVLASLKHPHIGALYDVGHEADTGYVVTEYLEGQTLAERLSSGPLELDEALKVGIAIADALNKAHRLGVVHRSLSPSSVMLTAGGAKLLDFGMALRGETDSTVALDSTAPTRSAPATVTAAPGTTLPYQSPEQIERGDSDARSDIFAFGAILYEMVTGKRAFEGKTQALVIAAIESVDPDPLSKTQPATPPALDFLVTQCLAKDPGQRLQTAWDLLSQLEWIAAGGSQIGISPAVASQRKKRDRIFRIALAAASVLALVLATATVLYYRGSAEPEDVRFIVRNMGAVGVTPGLGTSIGVSPDGRWLVTSQGTGGRGLDAVSFGSPAKQILLGENVPYFPFWKPDNQEIGFYEDGNLKKGKVSGGPSQNLCPLPPLFGGGAWSSTGVIVFSSQGSLYRVLDVGGPSVQIATPDKAQQETELIAPFFLPDGRHYLYLAVSSQSANSAIYVGALDSKERVRLFASESRAVYAEPGYLLYNRRDAVFARAFDASKLAFKGEETRVVDGVLALGFIPTTPVSTGFLPSAIFAVSQTGLFAYRIGIPGQFGAGRGNAPTGNAPDKSLIWFDASSRPTTAGPAGPYAGIDLAPDGKRFAVHRHDGDGGDIWLYDPDQGRMQRWTDDPTQENSMPVWSPDGKRIAFASRRNNKWGIYIRPADKTSNEELIVEPGIPTAPMNWTKADQIIYWVDDPKTRGDIWVVPVSGERKPVPILQTEVNERYAQVSPDGKWLAYEAPDAMGVEQIFINDFPKGPGHWQITNDGGTWPRWRGDGKELYFTIQGAMQSVEIGVAGSSIKPGAIQQVFPIPGNPNLLNSTHNVSSYLRFAVSADGQHFLVPQPAGVTPPTRGGAGGVADVILDIVDRQRAGTATVNATQPTNDIGVVLNWTQLLKQK